MAHMDNAGTTRMHPSQWLALGFGIVYVLIGVLGFFVTGFDDFARETDETLLGFQVNPLHNLAHLAIGALGLMMYRTIASARAYGWLLTVGFVALFVYGLMAVDNTDLNFLNINSADNVLHLLTAGLGLVMALWPAAHRETDRMRMTRPV